MNLRDEAAQDAALASVNSKPTWVRLDWLVANADRIAEAKINPMWSKRVRQARQEDDAAAIRRLVAVLGGKGRRRRRVLGRMSS
jgi:hypothetical protein